MPPPVEGYRASLPPSHVAMLDNVLSCSAIGAAGTVKAGVAAFIERTKADEIIVACSIFDPEKRQRSLEIAAEVFHSHN